MGGEDFAARDREAARIFGAAARKAGVKRIIYLGGLGEAGSGLSEHLRSRQETGDILRESGVPVVELRASIVLGSGSLSFEMIRALVERLPGHDLPALGRRRSPADRGRGRGRVPGRGARSSRRRRTRLRDRRPGPGDLRRLDARVRAPARLEAALDPGAVPDAPALEPLARPRHAALRARRPQARGQHAQPHGHPRPRRAGGLPRQAAGRARGDRPGSRERGRGLRPDALVGRRLLLGADRALRRRSGRHAFHRQPQDRRPGVARRRVRSDPANRRRLRLVLRQVPLAAARIRWTCSPGASACAAGAATRRISRKATPSTSGASKRSSPTACCGCAPR